MQNEEILIKISDILKTKELKIATAESATAGLIAHNLTNISGSSEYFQRGYITYCNEAKIDLLNVSKITLKKVGAVSPQVAKEMAKGVRIKSNSDIGLSTTGIAGPTGGTKEKPIGLVYVGFSNKHNDISKKFLFSGSRIENKKSFCNAALEFLFENIKD